MLRVGSKEIIWQPAVSHLRGSDLIIVEQASRLILNYFLWTGRRLGFVRRIALWGHGRNFQQDSASPLAEWVKRRESVHADWWFAYNAASVEVVSSLGFPRERITDVQNAIDDTSLRASLVGVTQAHLDDFLRKHDIGGGHVGLFVGSLYSHKRLGYLFEAADIIRSRIPDFELLVVGAGPDGGVLRDFAKARPWVHALGHQDSQVRACALRASRLMLIPGAVGLAVIDSFVAECPLVTVDGNAHGPEYGYLVNGVNGISLSQDAQAPQYAEVVVGLLGDSDELDHLREGCASSAGTLTMDEMVRRFSEGIVCALALDA
ncbi:MAG: glycosyltransferase [Bacteroidales bacterium]|nr:glycosyltransferase [Bacteroidales bacterium]